MTQMRIAIIGIGTVGGCLVDMFIQNGIQPIIICSTKKHLKNPTKNWRNELQGGSMIEWAKDNVDVMIDCTANESISHEYLNWKTHVIAANKKAFSGDLQYYKKLISSEKKIYFESSCGAGLPVLRTLSDLVKSGDIIKNIEGVLSGTLSYIFNNFDGKFSEIVLKAKDLGYTEPDPRDDLNGIDVMRKVLILGRVANLNISEKDIQVENIVPEPLRKVNLSEFLLELPKYDIHFENIFKKAKLNGNVLRYVGSLDFDKNIYRVALEEFSSSHVLSQLQGSDNIIKIVTKRFPNGLVIQGSGAGAEVTAFGCYSDYLRLIE
eukprot:NODE_104_length_19294_cov_0.449179.p8 type:complete len:321 gc:universal NODE_104_length_19294_cov_0.449179:8715-9677(+)